MPSKMQYVNKSSDDVTILMMPFLNNVFQCFCLDFLIVLQLTPDRLTS